MTVGVTDVRGVAARGAPEEIVLRDRVLQVLGGCWLVLMALAAGW